MIMALRKTVVSGLIVLSLSSLFASCDQTTSTVSEASPRKVSASGMTSADSAAFLADFPGGSSSSLALATVTTISLEAGDSILVSVQSTDCSGNPETVNVYGVISGVVVSGSCLTLTGTTVQLGPAAVAGTVSFRATHDFYGQGPAGNVSGSLPSFTVGMNDGYGDTDYNDVIISVRVIFHCAPSGDFVLDHPDFKSRYDSLMKISKVDSAVGRRQEWAMRVVPDPNAPAGMRINWPEFPGGPCGGSVSFDSSTIAMIHSHPYFENELNTPCWGTVPYLPDWNGGGSPEDWTLGIRSYAATPQWIFRFDPAVAERDRWKNKWRYQVTPRGCFVRDPIFPFN
jgi:hypothetical protein